MENTMFSADTANNSFLKENQKASISLQMENTGNYDAIRLIGSSDFPKRHLHPYNKQLMLIHLPIFHVY